jgi:hypothetical protein
MSADRPVVATVVLLALAAATFAVVRPGNFGGSDEWLAISLLSRGILDFPYANRPLPMIWGWPAWSLFPDRLSGFLVFHALWIGLGGVLVFLITRRLVRGGAALAFLAGAFTIVWAPADGTRLCAVQMILYSGCTFGVLLATWLAVEAWLRRRIALALGAVVAAAVAILSHEAALVPLALVPLLFLSAGGRREPRRLAVWAFVVFAALAAGGLRAALPLWTDPGRVSYQAALAEGLKPAQMGARTLGQLRRHLVPLVRPAWERPGAAVPIALAVFVAGVVAASRRAKSRRAEGAEAETSPGALLLGAGLGCLWALVSYLPFVATTHGAFRTEFLSAPGIGLLLAAAAAGVAALLPKRARLPAAILLGAWVVVLGTQKTVAFQGRWDSQSAYSGQRRVLVELTALAPDLAPGTLVVLLQRSDAWRFDLTFRHAVRYLYEGRAVGHVVGADPLLYETSFEAAGIRSSPMPALRGPWREPPALYAYDAVLAVREDGKGRLQLLESWPADLPALPKGARYAPRSRLRSGPLSSRRAILGS